MPTVNNRGRFVHDPVLERGLDTSTLFLVSFGFYLFLLASMVLVGGAPFIAVVRGPVALGHLCASLTMGLLWLLASRAGPSRQSLGALDSISIVVGGGFLSLMTLQDEGQILQTLLALMVTVMVRAMFSCRRRAASYASAPGCGPGASGPARARGHD